MSEEPAGYKGAAERCEELVEAFLAKYGCEPQEAVLVVCPLPWGGHGTMIRRALPEELERAAKGHLGGDLGGSARGMGKDTGGTPVLPETAKWCGLEAFKRQLRAMPHREWAEVFGVCWDEWKRRDRDNGEEKKA